MPEDKKMQEAAENSIWYYEANGARNGPVGEGKIKELILAGILKHGAHVWKKDFPDWMAIENTPLKSYLKSPPPLTRGMVSNTTVWVLSFAPLIGLFLEYFIWGFVSALYYGGVYPYHRQFFLITPILNIVLSIVDERKLKKAGHDTSKMGMAWLIPVYLFKRSKVLKQELSYFIVWIVCFVIVLFI